MKRKPALQAFFLYIYEYICIFTVACVNLHNKTLSADRALAIPYKKYFFTQK